MMKDQPILPNGNSDGEDAYTRLRPLMFSIAYRMLGSVSEAEDIVQEAYLRFYRDLAHGITIESPKAFLTTVTTRLAIDILRSARVRRETYIGPWLPEPLLTSPESDPTTHAEMDESLSLAFLLLLETLSPVERAVFLLREVFGYGYDEIAAIVQKSEANCRQIFTRAKKRVDAGRPRFDATPKDQQELATRFFDAANGGDLASLVNFLAADVVFYGDGGGKAHAYRHPIVGRERVLLVFKSLLKSARDFNVTFQLALVNGQAGALSFDAGGRLINVLVFDIAGGVIQTVRSIVNPDKLTHLGFAVSDLASSTLSAKDVKSIASDGNDTSDT